MTTLLLDFDGVMLKDKSLMNYQLRRSAKFVQKHSYLPLSVCEKINAQYYPHFGHTVMMINKLFNKNTTLEEYNDFVFASDRLQRLNKLYTKEAQAHLSDFEKIFEYANTNNMSWFIFTNAHRDWVKNFTSFDDDKLIWPCTLDVLKPKLAAYDRVESMFSANEKFIFVDDSRGNLLIPEHRPNKWKPIHFTKEDTAETLLHQISNISPVSTDTVGYFVM